MKPTADLGYQHKTETSATQQAASSVWSNTSVSWFSSAAVPRMSKEHRNISQLKEQLPYSPSHSSGPSLGPAVLACQEEKTKIISLWPSFEQDWRLQVGQAGRSTHVLLTRRCSEWSRSRKCVSSSPHPASQQVLHYRVSGWSWLWMEQDCMQLRVLATLSHNNINREMSKCRK